MAGKTTSFTYNLGGGQFAPKKGGQFVPERGGQFAPEKGGQVDRIFHVFDEIKDDGQDDRIRKVKNWDKEI